MASDFSAEQCSRQLNSKETGLKQAWELHLNAIDAFHKGDLRRSRQQFQSTLGQLRTEPTPFIGLFELCLPYVEQSHKQRFVDKDKLGRQLESISQCFSRFYIPLERDLPKLKTLLDKAQAKGHRLADKYHRPVQKTEQTLLQLMQQCESVEPRIREQQLALGQQLIQRYWRSINQ